jgi:predicted permease
MRLTRLWLRLVSPLVPRDARGDWLDEWEGELAARGRSMRDAWGALADAWYLRTEGWTMDAMGRDLRAALKALLRRPAFTVLSGVTLAVGIGANTAIFSVVDGVLIDPLPLPDPDRIVSYNHEAPGLGVNVPVIPQSEGMFLHYLEGTRALQALAVFSDDNVNLLTDGTPRQLDAVQVTQGYFDVMGVQPFLGRGFNEGEDREGAEPVVVLGYALWEQSFGADRAVLGTLVEMDGVRRRVIGVMPEGFALADEQLWLPLVIDAESPDGGSLSFIGVGRLAEGATVESADVEMQDLLLRYAEANTEDLPKAIFEQSGLHSDVKPLKDLFVQDVRRPLLVLLGTVGFVLLIACANVANLFLVQAEARQREQAVRTALGASRLDMVRQHLTESVVLALGGGFAGLALASFGVKALLRLAPADLPQALEIGIDGSVLLFTIVVSVVTGLLFGLFPVMGYGRKDLSTTLRDGGRAATDGRERHRTRSALVVVQVALAMVLLVGSGLMLRSFMALRDVDLGFEPAGLLTFRFALPGAEYESGEPILAFHRELTERLRTLPGVRAVGMNGGLPLTGSKSASPMEPVDRPFAESELAPVVERSQVTPGYFDVMSISIVEGRPLEWTDQGNAYRAVVVSEALAETFWPGESALGRMIRGQGSESSWEVVGVAGDVRFDGVREEPLPMVYQPVLGGDADSPGGTRSMDVVVAVAGDPLAAIEGARGALSAVDARLPMINPRTVDAIVADSMSAASFTVVLLGIAAGIALLLGTVGIYGVISYIVSRRTQEIGVRIALGAPSGTVLRGVVGEGMALTAIGLVLGLVGAWGVSRVLTSLLYGVSATDPVTFAGTAVLLAGVALLATWIPARRAARVDPVEALRAG